MASGESEWHTVTLRIPFASAKHATIAKDVIGVDRELQPHAVQREITVEGDDLVVVYKTLTVRLARLAINAFLESLDLVIRTLDEFGPDSELP